MLANAVASGDPVNVINAVQHSVADFATSVVGSRPIATISMGNYIADSFANALKQITPKPVPPPTEVLPTKALAAPARLAATTAVSTALEPETAPAGKAGGCSSYRRGQRF